MTETPPVPAEDSAASKQPRLRLGRKGLHMAMELLVILLVLVMVGGGVLLWRLNQGPLEIDFARKFIESELSDPSRSMALQVEKVYFDWSFADSRPRITLQDVRLTNPEKKQIVLAFDAARITLSRRALLVGQVSPRSIEINRPLLTIVRQSDGGVRLALEQSSVQPVSDEKLDLTAQSEEILRILDMMSKPPRDMPRGWPLRSLHRIAITDARMMVEDHVLNQSWLVPKIVLGFTRGSGALSVDAALWFEDTSNPKPGLRFRAEYQGHGKTIAGMLDIRALRADFLAEKFPDLTWLSDQNVILDGQARIMMGSDFSLMDFEASLESHNGQLQIPDLYSKAISYRTLDLDLHYDAKDDLWVLRRGEVDLSDGFRLSLSARGERITNRDVQSDPDSYRIPLTVTIHELRQDQVPAYWPDSIDIGSAREWAEDRLSGGRIHDSTIDMTLTMAPVSAPGTSDPEQDQGDRWSVTLDRMMVDFQIDTMDVDYAAPLLPVRGASGKGTYDYNRDRLEIDVTGGKLGDMDVQSGKVVLDTVIEDRIGTATIDAHLKGPLKTVFDYIALDPIAVDDVVADRSKIKGNADLTINISLPTLADVPAEQVIVSGTGTATDVFLPGIVSGLDVSGGPARVVVKDGRIDVSGTAQLSGRAMDFEFAQYFESEGKEFSARATASLTVDKDLRDHFGIDLTDWIEGSAPAKIIYTEYRGGKADVAVDVDATPLTLMVKPMNYAKAPGAKARASARAALQDNIVRSVTGLMVETPDGRTEGASLEFVQRDKETVLAKGVFPRVRLHETDVRMDFTLNARNVMDMTVSGSFLDARPFLENDRKKEAYAGPGLSTRVTVPRMRTTDARIIENVSLILSMDQAGDLKQLEMDAQAGRGPLVFRYKPDETQARMSLHIEAADAGAALQAFGIYENVVGGTFVITGQSAAGGNPRIVSGMGSMQDFKVVKAPALARLINAISLPGLLQLLGSDGISFTRLESEFTWSRVDGADLVTMKDGRTSGSSIGLTFDGSIDRVADVIDVSGAIVPVTLVNDILGSIPVLGQILSGGSRAGVFAATYTVKGDAKNPTITVNPLAVLAPGFLRRIFFE